MLARIETRRTGLWLLAGVVLALGACAVTLLSNYPVEAWYSAVGPGLTLSLAVAVWCRESLMTQGRLVVAPLWVSTVRGALLGVLTVVALLPACSPVQTGRERLLYFGLTTLVGVLSALPASVEFAPDGVTLRAWGWRRTWQGPLRLISLSDNGIVLSVGQSRLELWRDRMIAPARWKQQAAKGATARE